MSAPRTRSRRDCPSDEALFAPDWGGRYYDVESMLPASLSDHLSASDWERLRDDLLNAGGLQVSSRWTPLTPGAAPRPRTPAHARAARVAGAGAELSMFGRYGAGVGVVGHGGSGSRAP